MARGGHRGKRLTGALLAVAVLAATATASATVGWPSPDHKAPLVEETRQAWSARYREEWRRIGRTRHTALGTVTIGGRSFPLMLGACALPRNPHLGESGPGAWSWSMRLNCHKARSGTTPAVG